MLNLLNISYLLGKQFFQGGVEMIRRDLLCGNWTPYLERAVSLKPCYKGGTNGGEVQILLIFIS
jgi:hypothetical protein